MKQKSMRVLGIDPGFGRLGWAVVDGNRATQTVVEWGCFETKAGLEPSRRYEMVAEELERLIGEYSPQVAAVEDIFFFKNAKTVIKVAESRGVVVVGCRQAGLQVYDYTPLQVKQSVSGYGRADKKQVQQMVKVILKLESIPRPDDAADAVAVALTHLFSC